MPRSPSALKICLLMLSLLAGGQSQARTLRVDVAHVGVAMADVQGLQLVLAWPDQADRGHLQLDIEGMSAPAFGYRFSKLHWECDLLREADTYGCAGAVTSAQGTLPSMRLAMSLTDTDFQLASGAARVSVLRSAGAPDATRLLLRKVPVAWLRAFMASLWNDGRFSKGVVDAELLLLAPDAAPLTVSGPLSVSALSFDTPDGLIAGEGVSARAKLDFSLMGEHTRIALDGSLRGGELLVSSLYVPLPSQPVAVALVAEQDGTAGWRLHDLRWDDPGVLGVSGAVTLDPDMNPLQVDLSVHSEALHDVVPRYLSGPLGLAGLTGLQLSGALRATLGWDVQGPRRVDLHLDRIAAVAVDGRFALAGVSGDAGWTREAAPRDGYISWDAAAIYGLGIGASAASLRSANREIALLAPLHADLLGGRFTLTHLALTPRLGDAGASMRLGIALDGLDLGKLSQRLGWPPFTGSVGGVLPEAQYADNRLSLNGGITMHMFDGEVRIDDLTMERPFGVAPTLGANIGYDNLDLQPLTAAFGFGEITGRLDGTVHDLRMVDWTLAQFDADFHSRPGFNGKKRISQRAVQDLSNVGGGGLVAGLQNTVLKMFSSFGYSRIGLQCRLRENVCQMDGVGSAGQGYTIVEGSGLPHITVVGFARRVDWPILLQRLKAATEGQMPVVK